MQFQLITVFSLAFSLFLLMDPIGNVPIYLLVLKEIPPKRQRMIILRELVIALVIIIAFYFIGNALLRFLKISEQTVLLAGGIILFIIALRMVFPPEHPQKFELGEKTEPFIVPLAVPLIAGPSVLAAIMIYSRQEESTLASILAIVIAWIASTSILICSPFLQKVLGKRGLIALERLMGLILTLIAVQMFLEGAGGFINNHTHH